MMDAGDPRKSDDLTDDQLDALLASADEEPPEYIQAGTDPSATLADLMTIQADTETGNDTETGSNASASVVTVSYPCGSTARRRVGVSQAILAHDQCRGHFSGRRGWSRHLGQLCHRKAGIPIRPPQHGRLLQVSLRACRSPCSADPPLLDNLAVRSRSIRTKHTSRLQAH